LFLQKQNLATAIYLFGLGTLLILSLLHSLIVKLPSGRLDPASPAAHATPKA
jgi:hypothetical protein